MLDKESAFITKSNADILLYLPNSLFKLVRVDYYLGEKSGLASLSTIGVEVSCKESWLFLASSSAELRDELSYWLDCWVMKSSWEGTLCEGYCSL